MPTRARFLRHFLPLAAAPAAAVVLLVLLPASRLQAAQQEGGPAAQGSERQTGEHRLGVRVQLDMVPEAVRLVFLSHGGAALTSLNRRSLASGEEVYLARIIDTDASTQILAVSALGEIISKAPPRHQAAWLDAGSGTDTWAAEQDTNLWTTGWDTSADAFSVEQKPVDLSLWGPPRPRTDPESTVRIGPGGELATGALSH